MKPARWAALDAVIHSRLPLSCRAIYTAIHTACMEPGECDFDQQEFADSMHIPVRTLQWGIAKLRDTGHLIVEKTQTRNRYVMPWAPRIRERIGPQKAASATQPIAGRAPQRATQPIAEPEAALKNKVLKEEKPPLPPASGGTNVLSLEGAYEGCELCPLCGGEGEVVLRRSRTAECRECGGRGFIDPTWFRAGQTVSIGAKSA